MSWFFSCNASWFLPPIPRSLGQALTQLRLLCIPAGFGAESLPFFCNCRLCRPLVSQLFVLPVLSCSPLLFRDGFFQPLLPGFLSGFESTSVQSRDCVDLLLSPFSFEVHRQLFMHLHAFHHRCTDLWILILKPILHGADLGYLPLSTVPGLDRVRVLALDHWPSVVLAEQRHREN